MKNTNIKNTDPVLLRIVELLNKQEKTDKEFNEALGFANGTLYQWKNDDRRTAYYLYIREICEYLKTTPNYLFYGVEAVENKETYSSKENEIINMYQKLDKEKQDCIFETIRLFSN